METVSKKRKKAGRPVKAIKMEIRACVRFTKYEYYIVREKASQAGLNASGESRQTARHGKTKPRLSEDEYHFVRQLVGMSNNMNQVARVCHRDGLYEAMQYFENYRNLLDSILKKLKS